ncbi:hypothetical protein [Spiroplasma taiwanense]|uniref:Transmembrane protein n=1 Tax=Spiroplasma taiwanense CT-1 TaxID=1276220 RepID=S5MCA1_9MOLU|nr:hypothetical protein [Spiroplasma taiwanense]AGR41363.1 hypothetical protein STAIW_v1c07590 [Spiroplasma taiwanense CT-1]
MTGIEIGLLCGLIFALLALILMIFYLKWNKKNKVVMQKENQINLRPQKEIYSLFSKWLKTFILFFICLVIIFCFSMLIVELTK